MKVKGKVALVTGANRGLGAALVRALIDAGCAKVYAAARDVAKLPESSAVAIRLDVTDPEQVAAAAAQCSDVDILVNNAGVAAFEPLIAAPSIDFARTEMETNYFGTLSMCRAFAPALAHNGGGVIANVLSVVSWFNAPMQGSYCASKSAEWSLTKAVRFELRNQGTLVAGVYAGYIDTDMVASLTIPKTSPDDIVNRVLAGIEHGNEEILADERSETLSAELLGNYAPFESSMQQTWDEHQRRITR
jgi:NAD(P)-dependent dehydrogenase (short-subunit alcohol dehydrogenase family)